MLSCTDHTIPCWSGSKYNFNSSFTTLFIVYKIFVGSSSNGVFKIVMQHENWYFRVVIINEAAYVQVYYSLAVIFMLFITNKQSTASNNTKHHSNFNTVVTGDKFTAKHKNKWVRSFEIEKVLMGSGCFYLIYDAMKDQKDRTNRDLYAHIKWFEANVRVVRDQG